jgi:UDP-glucose 4-epimerase
MKVIVTGGAGFIGSNIVQALIKQKHNVIVIDNESSECHDNFYWFSEAENYKFDICDYDSILPLFNSVDAVFHLAAEARIQPSIKNPRKTINTNIIGTFNVLEAARHNSVKKVIYSSTSSAYGRKNKIPFFEDMKTDCLTPYSVSKVAGEEMCLLYNKLYDMHTIIFRYFNAYGKNQPVRGCYAPVIGLFEKQKSAGIPLTIVGNGNQKRDFTHIDDIVEANMLALSTNKQETKGQIYNVGTGKNYSILEICKMFQHHTIHIDERIGEIQETLSDNKKILNDLGWTAKKNLEDWIRRI